MYMVRALFLAGNTKVILDATNHTYARREVWQDDLWCIEHVVFKTSMDECIKRAVATDQCRLIKVIEAFKDASDFWDLESTIF
jgi:hypothetical protein